jgi:hypothetical protein
VHVDERVGWRRREQGVWTRATLSPVARSPAQQILVLRHVDCHNGNRVPAAEVSTSQAQSGHGVLTTIKMVLSFLSFRGVHLKLLTALGGGVVLCISQ